MQRNVMIWISAAALCATPAAPAFAQARRNAPIEEMRVKLSGLDLHSDAGAASALRRIVSASREFCSDDRGSWSSHEARLARRCSRMMTYKAVSQLDRPMVTARYEDSVSGPAIRVASR